MFLNMDATHKFYLLFTFAGLSEMQWTIHRKSTWFRKYVEQFIILESGNIFFQDIRYKYPVFSQQDREPVCLSRLQTIDFSFLEKWKRLAWYDYFGMSSLSSITNWIYLISKGYKISNFRDTLCNYFLTWFQNLTLEF